MKKITFILIFIAAHILFVVVQIHKQSLFTKTSYEKQKNEKYLTELEQKKKDLSQELYKLQSSKNVKKFSIDKLGMGKVKLDQVVKL